MQSPSYELPKRANLPKYRVQKIALVLAFWVILSGCGPGGASGVANGGDGSDDDDITSTDRKVAPGPISPITCNHGQIRLTKGVYQGDLVLGGNHCEVIGEGEATVIEGNVVISGNHNTVASMTVYGQAKISGNHCRTEQLRFSKKAAPAASSP